MAFDYIESQNDAFELIQEFGQQVPLVRVEKGSYDIATGKHSTSTIYQTTATVVSLPASGGKIQAFDNKNKEELKSGKLRFFYIAAKGLTFEPKQNDYILFSGGVYDVTGTTPLNPAGTPILYGCGCKAGNLAGFDGIVSDALNSSPSGDSLTFDGLLEKLNQIDSLDSLEPRVETIENAGYVPLENLDTLP